MTITAIILSHYKGRQDNLKRIVDDLLAGSVVPEQIIIFIDSLGIEFEDDRVTIIRSTTSFLPKIRFALASALDTDYCFFIDDDMTVKEKTLENFVNYASELSDFSILGIEGSILADTLNPYADDVPVRKANKSIEVDIIIRIYFVPTKSLMAGLQLQSIHKDLPRVSLDDVYLCLGNKYLNKGKNFVIPVDKDSEIIDLNDGGVGQSIHGIHYENRNNTCRKLMDIYL